MKTHEKGDIGMFAVMKDLNEKGYDIFLPAVSEHLKFDLVILKDNIFYKIQVKYRSLYNKTSIVIPGHTIWNDRNGAHKTKYEKGDFDYYAIYVPEFNKIIYPSLEFAGHNVCFKVPNSPTPFYWCEDFIGFTNKVIKKSAGDFGVDCKKIMSDRSKSPKAIESNLKKRKVIRPSKEELSKLLWEKPTTQIAKEFGVSDKAIEKWSKSYGISKPPRGYWEKKKHQKI